MSQQLSRQQIAWRVAQDIPEGAYVYLDSGMPLMVADHVPDGREVIFHSDSFAMVRGGHIDFSVLGACQVAGNGDLANRDLPQGRKAPAVGGAMDLAVGAKNVFVMMEYFSRDGSCKIVPTCTLPLTGQRCVTTIYTDIAVLDLIDGKVVLRELIDGITLYTLQAETPVELQVSPQLRLLTVPAPGAG